MLRADTVFLVANAEQVYFAIYYGLAGRGASSWLLNVGTRLRYVQAGCQREPSRSPACVCLEDTGTLR